MGSAILFILWVLAWCILSQYIVGLPMLWIFGHFTDVPLLTTVYNILSYALMTVMILVVSPKLFPKFFKKSTRAELGLRGNPTWADVGLAPISFVVYFLLASALTTAFSIFPFFDANQVQDVGYNLLAGGGEKLLAFFALVIFAPIAEELIFRGWLYAKLRAKIPGKLSLVLSVLLTSVAFGVIHLQWNVGVNVFALSLVACLLREITGTIYSGIILHILKNAIAFYLLYVII